jgi:acyl-CoA synthetase (NDP forming)
MRQVAGSAHPHAGQSDTGTALHGSVIDRRNLERLMRPESVAIVGASETSRMAETVAHNLSAEGVEIYLVNPKHDTVFGRRAYSSVPEIGTPIDAVLSLLPATPTVELAEQAADMDVGGLVIVASGFAESGAEGVELQRRLCTAAARGKMQVVGPNGVGYIDVRRGLDLTFLPRFPRRRGGVSLIAHSGALVEAFAASASRVGGAGLNRLISAGNEAVTDAADFLDYLVDDPGTRVVVVAIETVKRPLEFFAAAARARRVGKPIVAVKLGRSDRGRRIARSHTGRVTGDSWAYEVAFRQAGIETAVDIDEAVDRIQFLEQLPPDRWTPVRGLGVLTGTGGFSAMAADLGNDEKINIPEVTRLNDFMRHYVPTIETSNPLDATADVLFDLDNWRTIVETYAEAPELDALIYLSQFGDWDTRSRRFSDVFAEVAKRSGKSFFLSPLAGQAGAWVQEYHDESLVGVGNGLRGAFRGIQTMASVVRCRNDAVIQDPSTVATVARPGDELVESDGALMLPFESAMRLLRSFGIPTAPYFVVEPDGDIGEPPFNGPYVAKLADVPHRTEHAAVRIGLQFGDLEGALEDLRRVAQVDSLPAKVVIQSAVPSIGEAFVGVKNSELGPLVAFGVGGVFVDVLGRVAGKLAPFTSVDAREMIAEFDDLGVMRGLRGAPPWPIDRLCEVLVRCGELAAATRDWADGIDINPVIMTGDNCIAVDCTWFVRRPADLGVG